MNAFSMDASPTAPFTLRPKASNGAAVLMLHGFTGSPWEVRPLGEALFARGYHVHAPLLPGHGTDPQGMVGVSERQWLEAAREGLRALPEGHTVFLAGLSMGALLSLVLAREEPEAVKALVLMAPVWRLKPWNGRLLRALRKVPVPFVFDQWTSKERSDIEREEAHQENPILKRYPLARLLDLFRVQDLARAAAPMVRQPALVVAARQDHVVDFPGVQQLVRALPNGQLLVLERGFHILPRDHDRALLVSEASQFFDRQLAAGR
jgi:carboxylesterase